MTTYGEAVQMGITANLIEGLSTEITCAGDTISKYAEKYEDSMPESAKQMIAHVLNHLSISRELYERVGDDLDVQFSAFDQENPGKLDTISLELKDSKLIKDMQTIIGLTPEDVLRIIAEREAELTAKAGN